MDKGIKDSLDRDMKEAGTLQTLRTTELAGRWTQRIENTLGWKIHEAGTLQNVFPERSRGGYTLSTSGWPS